MAAEKRQQASGDLLLVDPIAHRGCDLDEATATRGNAKRMDRLLHKATIAQAVRGRGAGNRYGRVTVINTSPRLCRRHRFRSPEWQPSPPISGKGDEPCATSPTFLSLQPQRAF